jgi:hypothetical protein
MARSDGTSEGVDMEGVEGFTRWTVVTPPPEPGEESAA